MLHSIAFSGGIGTSLSSSRSFRIEQFNMVMEVARKISLSNPDALRNLIFALLRPLQSEHLLAVAECQDHQAPDAINGSSFFFTNHSLFSHSDHWIQDYPIVELNLACTPIFPTPWDRDRYARALALIGHGKPLGDWRQEPNHVVSLWLPWGIGFVSGGNHSISSGILGGEMVSIVPHEVFDFSPVLNLVESDGATYRSKQYGEVLAEVTDHRIAAVFEIGRLIIQHRVDFP